MLPDKAMKTATILVVFKTGSKYENKKNNGLSHFLEHMFFKGTEKYPNTLSLSSALDGIGAEYNAFTSKELTGYWIKAASSKMSQAVSIMHEMLEKSKFDEDEIDKERGVIVEELNMYQDNPLMLIEDILEGCLYGDSPAGWDTIGTKKNILNFKRSDFLEYYERQYGARSAFFILAGHWPKATEKLIAQKFSSLKRNKWQDKERVIERQKAPQLKIHAKKTDQLCLSLAVRTFAEGDKDETALKVLSLILGGTMSSRLFIELRERQGLAYHIRTACEFYSDSGYLNTRAGVPTDKLSESLAVILKEYKRLITEPVSKKELQKIKDLANSHLVLHLESSDDIASFYARQVISRKKLISPAEMSRQIKKISAADIQRVAKRIFVSRGLNLAVIGDVKNKAAIKNLLKL